MSRGAGHVQRGILSALERCPHSTTELTARLFPMWGESHLSSTRRALRALSRAGRVHCLGADLSGVSRWCLPEHRGLFTPPWKRQPETLGEALNLSEGWLMRAYLSSLGAPVD